ncbi:MAG: hypothetical protein K2I10_11380 [Lachnospiraceae bacterium]|nr:hypothetical protein [Lachnospiraceae bacterium]
MKRSKKHSSQMSLSGYIYHMALIILFMTALLSSYIISHATESTDPVETPETTEALAPQEPTTENPASEEPTTEEPTTEELTTEQPTTEAPVKYPAGSTQYFDVTTYGANGSDSIDDTAAIQKALDNAGADYNIVVTIPKGTYYISKTLYIQSNTTLKLAEGAIIRRSDPGLTKNMLKNSDAKHVSSKAKAYNLSQNITISGGTWDGGNINNAKSTSNLLYFGHASNIIIENTTIKNCYGAHAIEFAGVKDSKIRSCKISGFRYDSSYFTSEAIQLDICYKDSTYGAWAPGFKQDKTVCTNIVIEKCTITDYPRGIGVHHYMNGYRCNNIKIQSNTFQRSSASTQGKAVAGILLLGTDNVTIKSNKFNYYSYGAIIKMTNKLTIKSNTFKYNSYGPLTLESCDKNNARRTFTIVKKNSLPKSAKKRKKELKKFEFTCPYIKSGTVTIGGKSYKFKSSKTQKKITLKKVMKNNQTVKFYGKDSWSNKYYQTRTISLPNTNK